MNNEEQQKIFDEILSKATTGGNPQQVGGLDRIQMMIDAMDQGIMQLSRNIQMIGQGLDITQLKMNMIMNILVDKELITKEEVDERYQTEVVGALNKIKAKQEEEMKKSIEKIEGVSNVKVRPVPDAECSDCDDCGCQEEEKVSDVVLPSEKNEKVVF